MTLSMFTALTHFLDEHTESLRNFVIDLSSNPTMSAGVVIFVFVLGCLMISMFANR